MDLENRIAGVWVKASERLPDSEKVYFVRFKHTKSKNTAFFEEGEFYFIGREKGDNSVIEWLDESQPIPVNPMDIPEIPVHVKKILDMRDAIVQEDYDEVYHILYSIASPNFDKLEPWEELEKKSGWQRPIPVNKDKAVEILKELCNLKHYKDNVGKDAFYEKRQPELWKETNDFLNNRLSEPSQESGRDNEKFKIQGTKAEWGVEYHNCKMILQTLVDLKIIKDELDLVPQEKQDQTFVNQYATYVASKKRAWYAAKEFLSKEEVK